MKEIQEVEQLVPNPMILKEKTLSGPLRFNPYVYDTDWWYLDTWLNIHYHNSLVWYYEFRSTSLPVRCVDNFEVLLVEFNDYIRTIRDRVYLKKNHHTIENIIRNVSRLKYHKKQSIKYLGSKSCWSNQDINPKKLSYRLFTEAIDWLIEIGVCKKYKGSGGEGYSSVMNMLVFKQSFIDSCCSRSNEVMEDCFKSPNKNYIVINEKKGKVKLPRSLTSKEKQEIKPKENAMVAMCSLISSTEISICGQLMPEFRLHKVYNDDLHHGGRCYDNGEIQGKSKSERATISFNGERTVSLDYHHLHPALLYEKEGISLNGKDPYGVEVVTSIDYNIVDRWKLEYNVEAVPNIERNLAKLALLCMINAKSYKACLGAISLHLMKDKSKVDQSRRKFIGLYDTEVKTLVDSLTEHNKEISHRFFTGYGTVLQNLDSQMIDYCFEVFLDKKELLIPVHDCIIVRESLTDFGLSTMYDAYNHVLGSKMNCRVEIE